MDSERRARVKKLFLAARERRPEERAGYLEEACSDDAGLRRELESLLTRNRSGVVVELSRNEALIVTINLL